MRDAFIKRLLELAKKNDRVMLLTGDLGFGVLDQFEQELPRQYLNVGVAEQNMTGIAAGLALEGRIIFTYSIGNFPILRCLEQIRNDVCYHEANVKVVAIGGGFSYGSLGFSHHATEDLSILRALPEMTVVAPGDKWEAAEATDALISHPGPAYLRLDKSAAGASHSTDEVFKLGQARTVRSGGDVTLVACGGILGVALEAANALSADGIEVRVVSMHTVKPIDADIIIKAAQETQGIISLEEHSVVGGLGGAISEVLLDAGIMPKVFRRIGLQDQFSTIVGSQDYLRNCYGMGVESVTNTVKKTLSHLAGNFLKVADSEA